MNVQVRNIVESFKERISILQTVYEALSNSLEANSTKITITFHKAPVIGNFIRYDSFTIIDNGDGFGEKNRKSFLEYLSTYKLHYGCKGVGRFTWLKVFSKVLIKSQSEGTVSIIKFCLDFDESNKEYWNISPTSDCLKNETEIEFCNCKLSERDYIDLSLEEIKNNILNTFAIKLFFISENKKDFDIEIVDDDKRSSFHITPKDLLSLKLIKFDIPKSSNVYSFKLYYTFFNDEKKRKEIVLCADNRGIIDINKQGKIISTIPNRDSLVCFVVSRYLDESVNDSRTDFIFSKNEDGIVDLTRKEIEEEIKKRLENIVVSQYPSIKENNQLIIEECIDEYPYLKPFLVKNDSIIVEKETLIETAKNKYERKKEEAVKEVSGMFKNQAIDEKQLAEGLTTLNDFSSRELTKYFLYRQQIIDCLGEYIRRNEPVEKLLHDLFIPQGQHLGDSLEDRLQNNIWLLDDKFMSCKRAFSDVKVKTIRKAIQHDDKELGDDDAVEPDLTIFYSNKAAVVVEFKAIGAKTDQKLDAISEIDRNNSIIAKNLDGINSIYGFIVTHFDEKFLKRMSGQHGVKRMFDNNDEQMFYYYNENIATRDNKPIPCHTYIVSCKSIYCDSMARNKLFIDLIKKQ